MEHTNKTKSIIYSVILKIVCMMSTAVVLVAIQTSITMSGHASMCIDLNLLIHFLIVCIGCTISNQIYKRNIILATLLSICVLYCILSIVSITILTVNREWLINGFIGGVLGGILISLIQILITKKRTRHSFKKYLC